MNRDEKKSGSPTQPGTRSTAPKAKRRVNIIHKFLKFVKILNWRGRLLLAVLIAAVLVLLMTICSGSDKPALPEPMPPVETVEEYAQEAPEAESRFPITEAERWEIASTVTAEAGGEPFAGMMAVAQCILQSCEDDGIRPTEALVVYSYTPNRPEPTADALEAVRAVFDCGQVVSKAPIKYFYAPALVTSEWHESQIYVMTINGHKFYAERK